MRSPRSSLAILAFVALVTGACATYVWQRPGTPASVLEQDVRECDDLARRLALYYDMAADDEFWLVGRRPSPFGPTFFESSLAFERRTAQRCMDAKGYRLVKQPRPARADAGGQSPPP
jgi:hypothetical protein